MCDHGIHSNTSDMTSNFKIRISFLYAAIVTASLCNPGLAANTIKISASEVIAPYNSSDRGNACQVYYPDEIIENEDIFIHGYSKSDFIPYWHLAPGNCKAGAFAEGKDRATLAFGVNKGQERDSFGINRRPVTVYLTGKFREGRLTGVVSMVVETRPDTTGQILNPEWIRTRAKKIKETSVAVEHETQMLYDKDSVRLDPATVKAAYARENADTRTPAEKAQAARTRAAQLAALGAIGAVATGRGGQLLNEIGNSSRGAASSPKAGSADRRQAAAPATNSARADGRTFNDQPTYTVTCKSGAQHRVYRGKDRLWYQVSGSTSLGMNSDRSMDLNRVVAIKCGA